MIVKTVLLLLASSLASLPAERWRVSYFYDAPDDSDFHIDAFAFASPKEGMAAGTLESGHKHKPYAVATVDGGHTWNAIRIPDEPVSLFFLNGAAGWLLGHDDVWGTADFGKTWRKLGRVPGAQRVYFLSPSHGWAVGLKKSVYETKDGGATWTKLAAADQPKTTADYTVYADIGFANEKAGMITGWSQPPRRSGHVSEPEWVDPEEQSRRQWPTITIGLETRDGGLSWKSSEVSMFGQITRIALAPDGRGLGLVEFRDRFDYPSEVFRFDWRTGKSVRAFRRRDRAVTDVSLPSEGPAYLAAIEPSGALVRSPIPGKLKILKSLDLEQWTETDVDYRAEAARALLATPAPFQSWVACDTGMILQLASE